MKATQIEDYFKYIEDQLTAMANDPGTAQAFIEFNKGLRALESDISDEEFEALKDTVWKYYDDIYLPKLNRSLITDADPMEHYPKSPIGNLLQYKYIVSNPHPLGEKDKLIKPDGDSSYYAQVHAKYHPSIRDFMKRFGYYDIFYVHPKDGRILYSVYKEVDFSTNLTKGIYSNSNIADVFRNCVDANDKDYTCVVDFAPYHPSYNAPAGFIAKSVFQADSMVGVLIFQLPIEKINSIMTSNQKWSDVGLGESGETYIVGQDFTLRNESRFLIEDSTNYFKLIKQIGVSQDTIDRIRFYESAIKLQKVRTPGTLAALEGKTGTQIFEDYRGVPVLSSYKPLNISGLQWVIMSEIDEAEAFSAVTDLRWLIIGVFGGVIVMIFVVSIIVATRITKPIKRLTAESAALAAGNLDVVIKNEGRDEIGQLSESFREMQKSISSFVHELEDKVAERTKELQEQKEMVEEKNREIVDSINYAKRLQGAILPTIERIQQHLGQSFILYKPKDIVSGDFYWMDIRDRNLMIAAVDCTGHGVPGAMVSVVGANGLNRCVKEFGFKEPARVLDKLVDLVIETFDSSDQEVKDGMDIALCSLNLDTFELQFSGAHNPLWIVKNQSGEITEIKGNKQPIGSYEFRHPFDNHTIQLETGDCFYIFTDGYADQFGGPRGKKFKYKTLKELLVEIHDLPMDQQMKVLDERFEEWRGNYEQVDDVCLIGIRI